MRYTATTFFPGHRTHVHEYYGHKWKCAEKHKKPKPLKEQLTHNVIAYLVGVATPVALYLIR